jgi:heptosyltransferase II
MHQVYEYLDLLTPGTAAEPEPPHVELPDDAVAAARNRLAGLAHPRIAFIPGAARGPSKQWPAAHFVQLGKMLAAERGCGIAVFGSSGEAELCAEVAAGIGAAALNLCGQTGLAEWIALMKICDLVVCNDSGGMHLAAAAGTPLVALYGITDPARTGPLGTACRVLQNSAVQNRDVDRDSAEARASLASIPPEQVFAAVLQSLERKGPSA